MASNVMNVKREMPDEAEIAEMAAKMIEANKQKSEQAAALSAVRTIPSNNNMNNFLNRIRKADNETKEKKTGGGEEKDKIAACDEESQRGRFGWITLGKSFHVPYLFRNGEKYCAVRIVETKPLKKYLSYLHSDIYTCTCIRSYYITEAEARLLNEINFKHCECQYGKEQFTSKDLVVRLSDTAEFYDFLDLCYNKLISKESSPKDRCGFVRINRESVVPYTVRDNRKFVPLFYFEGETDSLKLKAVSLDGWDLAYLKFCCKVQGIRNELFASETCLVISLADIKSYFPPGTNFELYWPMKVHEQPLLLPSHKMGMSHASGGLWTRQPSVPPPQPSVSQPETVIRRQTSSGPSINNNVPHSSASLPSINGWNNGYSSTTNAPSLPGQTAQQSQVIRITPSFNYQNPRSSTLSTQSHGLKVDNNFVETTPRSTSAYKGFLFLADPALPYDTFHNKKQSNWNI